MKNQLQPLIFKLVLGMGALFAFQPVASALTPESQNLLLSSYTLEAQGIISDAIAKTVAVYKSEPNDYLVNLRLGWLFYLDKKYKNSMEHYVRAAYAAPYSVEPLLGLSQTELTVEDYSKTAETCKLIVKLDPGSYLGHQRLIRALLKLKLFAQAAEVSDQALVTYPTDPIFLEQKGFALKEQGKTEEAYRVLSYLLLVSPSNTYAHSIVDTYRPMVVPPTGVASP